MLAPAEFCAAPASAPLLTASIIGPMVGNPFPSNRFAVPDASGRCANVATEKPDRWEVSMHRHVLDPWLLGAGWLVLGCSDQTESVPTAPTASLEQSAIATSVTPGDPLAWVTPAERARFEQGAELFDVEFEDATGLG